MFLKFYGGYFGAERWKILEDAISKVRMEFSSIVTQRPFPQGWGGVLRVDTCYRCERDLEFATTIAV